MSEKPIKTDAPLASFAVGGYPTERCEGYLRLVFYDAAAARALAKRAAEAADLLEFRPDTAAVTSIVAVTTTGKRTSASTTSPEGVREP